MPATALNEALFQQRTPWVACAALEEFFAAGGQCKTSDATNWVGIAFTCAMKAESDSETSPQLHYALAWAHLAVAIRESLAASYSGNESWGIVTGAMWVRANMIVRCGSHPQDHLCDCDKVVDWCLTTPQVQHFLKMQNIPPFASLEPEVREVADILTTLITASRLEEISAVADFMSAVATSVTQKD